MNFHWHVIFEVLILAWLNIDFFLGGDHALPTRRVLDISKDPRVLLFRHKQLKKIGPSLLEFDFQVRVIVTFSKRDL